MGRRPRLPPCRFNAICLNVSGNRATIVATLQAGSDLGVVKVTVVDSPPGKSDQSGSTFSVNPSVLPSCATPLAVAPVDGSVTVTDAQPSPSSKDQCKNGGWAQLPRLQEPGPLRQLRGDAREQPATRGNDRNPRLGRGSVRGERGDSNPRPPGPQPAGLRSGRSACGLRTGSPVVEVVSVALRMMPH